MSIKGVTNSDGAEIGFGTTRTAFARSKLSL